jgi:hypothetical protein
MKVFVFERETTQYNMCLGGEPAVGFEQLLEL